MFYKYPEEFIVSVKYDNDLELESNPVVRKFGLLEDDDEFGMLSYERDIENLFRGATINLLQMNKSSKEKSMLPENIVEYGLEDESDKDILSEIDEEYANSEVGAV